jgi:ribosomal protein S18 acetylase RimI-like enzyme
MATLRAAAESTTVIRAATPDDAEALVRVVLMAGDGLPVLYWSAIAAPGEDPIAAGLARVRSGQGAFSYHNAFVADRDGRTVGGLVGYPIVDGEGDLDGFPPPIRPLIALEAKAVGRWYVNIIAVDPEARRTGVASRLLAEADLRAKVAGTAGLCLSVADSNHAARRLYEAAGYRDFAFEPMVKEGWDHPGSAWILMVKD